MGLEAIGQQGVITGHRLWGWSDDLTGGHPYLAQGSLVVGVLLWLLITVEVRERKPGRVRPCRPGNIARPARSARTEDCKAG